MKNIRKLRRAQPRSKTPPISFREESDGERVILLIDESFSTGDANWLTTTRQPMFLSLGPGLALTLGTRRVQKRRYARLLITAEGKALAR